MLNNEVNMGLILLRSCLYCDTNITILSAELCYTELNTGDEGIAVCCPHCCAQGPASTTIENAINAWNGKLYPYRNK